MNYPTAETTHSAVHEENEEQHTDASAAKVLCPHCKRTADNGIRCLGMCVADNEY